MLGIDRLCKDKDFYARAKSIPLHCSEGIENHEANVSNTTNSYNHSRSEIPPERSGDSCPHIPACLKALTFIIIT